MKRQKFFLLTLGCAKNRVDGEEITAYLEDEFDRADDPQHADIIVINTCAFVQEAAQEAIDSILEAAEYKRSGSCSMLVVAGCLTARFGHNLKKSLPEVDIFVGPAEIPRIAHIILNGERGVHSERPPYLPNGITKRNIGSKIPSAYIKIGDGCSRGCSYCTIPAIRGKGKSRPIKDIVDEAAALLDSGIKELTLVSQDTSVFGNDSRDDANILQLMAQMSNIVNESRWIRLLYSQPSEILIPLAEFLVSTDGFAPYLDVPIQHVSTKILKSMHRPSFTAKIIRRLRNIEGLFLRTTVMVGFPGETKREFDELMDFIQEIEFDHLGAFTYSPEDGTRAAGMKERPRSKTAQLRLEGVMELQAQISRKRIGELIGQQIPVLVEEKKPDGTCVGRHIGQAPEIDGATYLNGDVEIGNITEAKITGIKDDYDLTAIA